MTKPNLQEIQKILNSTNKIADLSKLAKALDIKVKFGEKAVDIKKRIAIKAGLLTSEADKAGIGYEDDDIEEIEGELMEGQKSFVYIGKGDEPPFSIDFMSKVRFHRGKVTKIDNTPENQFVIEKLRANDCFIESDKDISPEESHVQDAKAKAKAIKQQEKDKALDEAILKAQRKLNY